MRKLAPAVYCTADEVTAQVTQLEAEANALPVDQRSPLLKKAAQFRTYADLKRWAQMPIRSDQTR
jgi:hypothetical protein